MATKTFILELALYRADGIEAEDFKAELDKAGIAYRDLCYYGPEARHGALKPVREWLEGPQVGMLDDDNPFPFVIAKFITVHENAEDHREIVRCYRDAEKLKADKMVRKNAII